MITIINFKTYKQGKDVLDLAKTIEKVSKEIIVGVQPVDIQKVKENTKLRVYAQHVDFHTPGRNTGFITPESVKKIGAEGTFLNHSEHKIDFETLKKTIQRCKKIKLKTAVFAPNLDEARKIDRLKPEFIIFEPKELVASKISVSKAKPELIKKISEKVKTKFLVGAGIHEREDVETALKQGAKGIAVSSAITQSKNPGKKLKKLILS